MHNAAYEALGIEAEFKIFEGETFDEALRVAYGQKAQGLAVTAPFKLDACAKARTLDSYSAQTGASNTLLLNDPIEAYNTDVYGIRKALVDAEVNLAGLTVVIVGAGGTARAAIGALSREYNVTIQLVVRDIERAQPLAKQLQRQSKNPADVFSLDSFDAKRAIKRAGLIIQTTPIGWEGDDAPFDLQLLEPERAVLDVIYRKQGTALMKATTELAGTAIGGEQVLLNQALRQFELFTGHEASLGRSA
jgi:shikimate dehydrogenase